MIKSGKFLDEKINQSKEKTRPSPWPIFSEVLDRGIQGNCDPGSGMNHKGLQDGIFLGSQIPGVFFFKLNE